MESSTRGSSEQGAGSESHGAKGCDEQQVEQQVLLEAQGGATAQGWKAGATIFHHRATYNLVSGCKTRISTMAPIRRYPAIPSATRESRQMCTACSPMDTDLFMW